MRFIAEAPVKNQCVQLFIESHRRLGFYLDFDGRRIVATWSDWVGEREKAEYEAEVDLLDATIVIYEMREDKKRRKLCKSRLDGFAVNYFYGLVLPKKRRKYLSHTECVNDDVCLVPVYHAGYPMLAVVNREDGVARLVSHYVAGDVAYFADVNADLAPPTPQEEFNEEALRAAVQRVSKYGAEVAALALLPYLQPHAVKRFVPVIVGPMRSGKTNTLNYIYSAWPLPKKYVNTPSAPSLRNTLMRNHVVADDVGEDPKTNFDWRIVIPYFERGVITRVNPQNLKEVSFVMRGALVVGTNAPADDIRSVQDRLRYFHAGNVPPGETAEEDPAYSWLTYNPFIYMARPAWLSAIDVAISLLFGEEPPPPPQHDPLNEPYSAFLYQLYRKLTRLKAQYTDPCQSKHYRRVGDTDYLLFMLKNFANPLYDGLTYTKSLSVSIRDVKTVTITETKTVRRYSTTEAKLIIEHYRLPVEVRSFGTNTYVMVPCDQVEEVYSKIKTALNL
jgi:hypothetical protein